MDEDWEEQIKALRHKELEKRDRYEFEPPLHIRLRCNTCARPVGNVFISKLSELVAEAEVHEAKYHV